eukprot:TRINITY_DN386_c0_g1_i2.p1 TRINITY_DN386_c0_g1~~TRINITY_DN386_c0_g1_i2.p1  ORF type:complete len:595 (-),score=133.86 TRINITY_DN386_c0_g1_i2:204-1988(-)
MSDKEGQAKAPQISEEQLTEANNGLQQAVALINSDMVPEAIELLTHVMSVYMSKYGQTALECAPAYFRYGQALLFQAQDAGKDNAGMDASSKNDNETQQGQSIKDIHVEDEEEYEESEESEEESDEEVEDLDEVIAEQDKRDETCEIDDTSKQPTPEQLQSDLQYQEDQEQKQTTDGTTEENIQHEENIDATKESNANTDTNSNIEETPLNVEHQSDQKNNAKESNKVEEGQSEGEKVGKEEERGEPQGEKVEKKDLTNEKEQMEEEDKVEDDQQDGVKADNVEDEEEELSDVEQDLQAAWEYLETARYIYEQNGAEKYGFQLAEIRSCLGDVSAEQEDFETAISDYKSSLELFKLIQSEGTEKTSDTEQKINQVDNIKITRHVAETHFKLALAMQFSFRYKEAASEINAALEMLNALATELSNTENATNDEGIQKNLNELQGSIEDLTSYKGELKALECAGGVARIKSAIEAAQKVADKEVADEANDDGLDETKKQKDESISQAEIAFDKYQDNGTEAKQVNDEKCIDMQLSPRETKENQGLPSTATSKQETNHKRSRTEDDQVLGEKNEQLVHKKLKPMESSEVRLDQVEGQ